MKKGIKFIKIFISSILSIGILFLIITNLFIPRLNLDLYTKNYIATFDSIFSKIFFSIIFYSLLLLLIKYLLSIKSKSKQNTVIIKYDIIWSFVIYLICTILFFYPILPQISHELIGPPEDNLQGIWNIWWGYKVHDSNINNFSYTNYLFYPEGGSLLYHDFSFLNCFISILLKPLNNLVLIYNLLILSSFVFTGVSAFILIRYLTKNSYAAFLGGFIFSFCPYHIAHSLHHLNLSTIYFIPLFVLYFIKSIKEKSKFNIFGASLFFFLCAITHWNYFIFNIFFMALSYIYIAIKNKKIFLAKIIFKIFIIIAATIIILAPVMISMIIVGWNNSNAQAILNGPNDFVIDTTSLFIPHDQHLLANINIFSEQRNNFTGNAWETTSYLGIISIISIIVFFIKTRFSIAKYIIGALTFLLLAGGNQLHFLGHKLPIILPYSIINQIPFFANARIPARNILFVYLFLAIIISFIIKYIFDQKRDQKKFIVFFLIISLLIFLDFYSSINISSDASIPKCYSKIQDKDKSYGIINLPINDDNLPFSIFDTKYMLYQTSNEIPIANGYVSRKLLSSLVDNFDQQNFKKQKEQLEDNNIKYLILHKNFSTSKYLNYAEYKKHYQQICEDSEIIIYNIEK